MLTGGTVGVRGDLELQSGARASQVWGDHALELQALGMLPGDRHFTGEPPGPLAAGDGLGLAAMGQQPSAQGGTGTGHCGHNDPI